MKNKRSTATVEILGIFESDKSYSRKIREIQTVIERTAEDHNATLLRQRDQLMEAASHLRRLYSNEAFWNIESRHAWMALDAALASVQPEAKP